MCGIAGTVGFGPEKISEMRQLLSHRGPDDNNILLTVNKNVNILHTRLAIIDPTESGRQPIDSHRYALTYNGEIYNYKDFSNGQFQYNDAYALLCLIYRVGPIKALEYLNGMFAFGVLDKLEHKLYLAVDRFGQKPLYYYRSGKQFAFASTPAALTCLQESWELNTDALDSYWELGAVASEDSLFDGIKKLLAAHVLIYNIDSGIIETSKYWAPQNRRYSTSDVEDLVVQAIERVKISDVPISILLSGGIDSTLVASRCKGMVAYHLDSPEIEHARTVARKYELHLNIIDSKDESIINYLTDFVAKSGVPAMGALIPYMTCMGISREHKVAISANGADELFFGYNRTQDNYHADQVKHIFRRAKNLDFYRKNWDIDTLASGRMLELYSYVQFDLNQTLDFAAMANGVETRCPFLDHELVEAALNIKYSSHVNYLFGNKTILKYMLSKQGFDSEFLTRPKIGFSWHYPPSNYEAIKEKAFNWCIENKYLRLDHYNITGPFKDRNLRYLEASAIAFYYWFNFWKYQLKNSQL